MNYRNDDCVKSLSIRVQLFGEVTYTDTNIFPQTNSHIFSNKPQFLTKFYLKSW